MKKYFGYSDGTTRWKEAVGSSLYVYKAGTLKIHPTNDSAGDRNNTRIILLCVKEV